MNIIMFDRLALDVLDSFVMSIWNSILGSIFLINQVKFIKFSWLID